MEPLLSIIIPVYNQADVLQKALSSVANQTYGNLEVILVDDGSKEEFKIEDLRFKNGGKINLVRQENAGAPVARNKGFELSHGEYIIFWDADIVGNPDMIQKMYQALQNNPDASYSYCNFYFGSKKMKGRQFDAPALKKNNYIITTSLIRRNDYVGFSAKGGSASGWDEKLKRFQDWDLWLSMLEQNKKGVWIDEYLFKAFPGGTMSKWLPSFAYKKPWRYLPGIKSRVDAYESAKEVVIKKHSLC